MIPDRELVQRALVLDDRSAFSDLVRKYQRDIRAYLFRRTRDREWADDLAQETFLQSYRNLDQLGEGDKFRGWLFSIAHRQFLQGYRSRGSQPNTSDLDLDDLEKVGGFLAGGDTDRLSASIDLKTLLATLRPIEQEAVVLCLGHELSHTEAAELLQLSVGTVKSLVLRAREKLRGQNHAFSDGGSNG